MPTDRQNLWLILLIFKSRKKKKRNLQNAKYFSYIINNLYSFYDFPKLYTSLYLIKGFEKKTKKSFPFFISLKNAFNMKREKEINKLNGPLDHLKLQLVMTDRPTNRSIDNRRRWENATSYRMTWLWLLHHCCNDFYKFY